MQLRAEIFDDLEQCRRRGAAQTQLLRLLGITSAALAHACHLLGRPDESMAQARLARQCADEIGHIELGAWACGTLALLAEGAGRVDDGVGYIRESQDRLQRSPVPGSAAVRLACYEARILARRRGDVFPRLPSLPRPGRLATIYVMPLTSQTWTEWAVFCTSRKQKQRCSPGKLEG